MFDLDSRLETAPAVAAEGVNIVPADHSLDPATKVVVENTQVAAKLDMAVPLHPERQHRLLPISRQEACWGTFV